MELSKKIEEAVEASFSNVGYRLVQVKVIGGSRVLVEIYIERLDDAPVKINDCVEANHLISAILDVEDFIKTSYNLQVSSPGENRPITKIEDFKRFCGKDANIELYLPLNGKRKYFGKLVRVEQKSVDSVVYLKEECDTGAIELEVPYKSIKKASIKRFF